MYITARERKILEVILLHEGEMTVSQIAKILDVSSRTVHRDLKGVEDILTSYGLTLTKQSGVGIAVKGEKENQEKLKLFLFSAPHTEFSPEERQTIILSALLESLEPVKLMVLANDLNVTIATISNDLNKIEERIASYGLSLIRKRGYGVQLDGTEQAKRKVMSSLILDHLEEFEFISFIRENIQKRSMKELETITDRLLGLVDKKKLIIIEKIVDDVKKELPYPIADSAYIGLVVHLALATERIQQGVEIALDDQFPEQLVGTKEYTIAEKIVSGLEEAFRITVSSGEVSYITMHLLGAKLRNEQGEFFEESAVQLGLTVQKLIRIVSERLGMKLDRNLDLYQGLLAHLRPALYRMRQNMNISNPLLTRIREDYPDLFRFVAETAQEVFPEFRVPEEEVGYLVMHFASAVLKGEEIQEYSALVVCSSGIGTSKLLSTKLQKEMPWLITQSLSLFELDQVDPSEYSIVISTVPLTDYYGDYILVSPVLSMTEIERIKQSVNRQIPLKRQPEGMSLPGTGKETSHFLEKLETQHRYAGMILEVMKSFTVQQVTTRSVTEILLQACQELATNQWISQPDAVYAALLEREQVGGLGIPGTSLSLYHAKSNAVNHPIFRVYRLEAPLQVRGMDDQEMWMQTILLMLSPLEISSEGSEVLSTISASIIQSEETIHLFEQADQEAIFQYIGNELQELYQQK